MSRSVALPSLVKSRAAWIHAEDNSAEMQIPSGRIHNLLRKDFPLDVSEQPVNLTHDRYM